MQLTSLQEQGFRLSKNGKRGSETGCNMSPGFKSTTYYEFFCNLRRCELRRELDVKLSLPGETLHVLIHDGCLRGQGALNNLGSRRVEDPAWNGGKR